MKEIYDYLKASRTYYLATVEGDQPRVRPFGTIDLFEGKLYIQTGKSKAVARQMTENPKIEICAFQENGTWIRVTAEAQLDDRIEAQQHMLDAYPELSGMYKPGDGNTQVYCLKNGVAHICSFTAPPREIKF